MKFSNPQSRFHQAHNWAIGLCAVALIPLLAACPGPLDKKLKCATNRDGLVTCVGNGMTGGTGGMGGTVQSCDAPMMVFNNVSYGCAAAAICHAAGTMSGLDLQTDPEAALFGKNSSSTMSTCTGQPFIDASGMDGVLFKRMTGGTCGPQMPFPTIPVMPQHIECVKNWAKAEMAKFDPADFDSTDDPALGANE